MEGFSELFAMLGIKGGMVISIGTVVYAMTALLRKKLPGNMMKGWKSNAVGAALALLLAWKAMPADLVTAFMTGAVAWGFAMVGHEKIKGTKAEIKRNGK